MIYKVFFSKKASRDLKKYKKKSPDIYLNIGSTLDLMVVNPFASKLRTHKVKTSKYGGAYSTRITGDVRILWKLKKKNIEVLAIGGHSGKHTVYICL